MGIKRMIRKPLLPVLLLLIVLLGILFPAVLGRSMEKNYKELEGLYEGMTIRCELLPQAQIGDDFMLETGLAKRIVRMEEVSEYDCEMICPYNLRAPGTSTRNSTAYGTNDIEWFAGKHNLNYELSKDYEKVDFSGSEKVCLISRQLLELLALKTGDSITVAGSERIEEKDESAPDLVLTVVGTFYSEDTDVPWNAVITPESCFFDQDGLIYTAGGVGQWRLYRAFEFFIDPSYNRTFDTVKESLQKSIGSGWMLYSTSRELFQAVQPLEKKLDMQQLVYRLVTALFLLLPAVITVLICFKNKKEILIRIVYGEGAGHVFVTYWLSVAGLLCLAEVVSAGIGFAFGNVNVWYAAAMLALSISAAAATIGIICRTRLVKLYQSSGEE